MYIWPCMVSSPSVAPEYHPRHKPDLPLLYHTHVASTLWMGDFIQPDLLGVGILVFPIFCNGKYVAVTPPHGSMPLLIVRYMEVFSVQCKPVCLCLVECCLWWAWTLRLLCFGCGSSQEQADLFLTDHLLHSSFINRDDITHILSSP